MSHSLLANWRPLQLGRKLSLGIFLVVSLVFAAFVAVIGYSTLKLVEERAHADVAEKTRLVVDLIDAAHKDLHNRTALLAKSFQSSWKGTFALDPATIDIKGQAASTLTVDGKTVNLDYSVVNRFTETTGAVATVFATTGDDFVRITTLLKDEKGARAIGTLLDRAQPGYQAVLARGSYSGLAMLVRPAVHDPVRPHPQCIRTGHRRILCRP